MWFGDEERVEDFSYTHALKVGHIESRISWGLKSGFY